MLNWRAGAWQTLLELKNDGTATANGRAFDLGDGLKAKPAGFLLILMHVRKQDPGLWIRVNMAGSDGQGISEATLFHYSNKTRSIEIDGY